MKRVLFLADPYSVHTYKWATSLSEFGYKICIFSLRRLDENSFDYGEEIEIIHYVLSKDVLRQKSGSIFKLKYLGALRHLRKTIKNFKPSIIHAHYASSYGLLGALSGFHPLLISLWGSDIYDFPQRSYLHKRILKYNLSKADVVLSTSKAMADEAGKYIQKPIEITPFGIDIDIFQPLKTESVFGPEDIVIGTVKALEKIYGIDYLLRAFKLLKQKHPSKSLKLLIVGEGSQKQQLIDLVSEFHLENDVAFPGWVRHEKLPAYINMIDVFVVLSRSESFGVAVLEASSCGKAVVVSDAGGLPEVVKDKETGMVVPSGDVEAASQAIGSLITDEQLRMKFGNAGRKRVLEFYNWQDSVKQMADIYEKLIGPEK
ncbi:MAG: glycosyltransferase family 4 protein [Bacteroidetes bacterium]|nr:glycosyltransferase family 4 protein [Bacteroidota bacterium]